MASSSEVNRRRTRPAGTPDPMSEVIALPPEILLENLRYNCFICYKGFCREPNLQIHLRSHNIQSNLQRSPNNGNRKKVYVCPEPTCVYHHPSRALSDITGIKKHYARKHSTVKDWECYKCTKSYAVEADLKAHVKKCKINVQHHNHNDELIRERNDEPLLAEDGRDGHIRPSVGVPYFSTPLSPLLAPFASPHSTENSVLAGPSRNANEFTLESIPEDLTFTQILNGGDSDEVVKAYNEAVFDIIQMQSNRPIPQPPPSPSMPYSTSFFEMMLNPMDPPAKMDGFPTELSLSLGSHPFDPPHTLSSNTSSLWPGLNQPNTQLDYHVPTFQANYDQPAMGADFQSNYVDNGFMNPGFNTMMGMTPGVMVQGTTIQPETIENVASTGSQGGGFYHNFMFDSMDEAMGLGGPSSGAYRGPFSG